jgi:hypothetical protein
MPKFGVWYVRCRRIGPPGTTDGVIVWRLTAITLRSLSETETCP